MGYLTQTNPLCQNILQLFVFVIQFLVEVPPGKFFAMQTYSIAHFSDVAL